MSKQNTTKPLIAVTTDDRFISPAWLAICFNIWLAGGKAVRVCPKKPADPQHFDGFLISGGTDIDPQLYGKDPQSGKNYDIKRDKLETDFIRFALTHHKPLMGICRGYQLINVIKGGDIFVDISQMRQKTKNGTQLFPVKPVTLQKNSKLAQRLGGLSQTKVNAIHHQAVDSLAKELIPAAYDADHFLQAFESRDDEQPLFGVQWHPEYLFYLASQRNLFKWLVEQARL